MNRSTFKTLLMASAMLALSQAQSLAAETVAATPAADDSLEAVVVSIGRATRSAVSLEAVETQKLLPGINPLKAIQTLPGVLLETADPWGNNEQNESLFVHGFNTQQLGYTMDGIPLGDQNYGNYNGLSPQRAVISENVGRVVVTTASFCGNPLYPADGDHTPCHACRIGAAAVLPPPPAQTDGPRPSQRLPSLSTPIPISATKSWRR